MPYDPKKENDDAFWRSIRDAALSGSLSGLVLGAGGRFLGGGRTLADLAKAGAGGAALSGGISGGSVAAGNILMGPPEEEETQPYTRRGALGGLAGGALLGGLAGGLAGAGKIPKAAGKLKGVVPTENLLFETLAKYGKAPTAGRVAAGTGIGAGTGGIGSAFLGSDEGMQVDMILAELDEAQKRRLLAELENNDG